MSISFARNLFLVPLLIQIESAFRETPFLRDAPQPFIPFGD
jgi:hypothetical protein